jgi:hypothetical protein
MGIFNTNTTGTGKTSEPIKKPSARPRAGYSRIAAWVKKKYSDKIQDIGKTKKPVALEHLAGEAVSGLSEKTKKGFLEYLQKQDYKQLLK